jgi:5'(3')-deoxyribonucleotidase
VRLQTQIPWLVFPFLLYQAVILTTRKMTVKPVPTLD